MNKAQQIQYYKERFYQLEERVAMLVNEQRVSNDENYKAQCKLENECEALRRRVEELENATVFARSAWEQELKNRDSMYEKPNT